MLEKFGLVESNINAVKIGDVFGRLSVKAIGQVENTYRYYAICQCSCGAPLKRVRIDGLKNGVVVGCGCVQKEKTTKHGLTGSDHLKRWTHMMDRCYNEKCSSYKHYGARGIKVCDAWHDVTRFVADLPDGYKKGLEIDRIDNDGNYEPGNIRWATCSQNCLNRRSNRVIEFNGEKKHISQWAEQLGIDPGTLTSRIDKMGWPLDRALTQGSCKFKCRVPKSEGSKWREHIERRQMPPKQRTYKTVEWEGKKRTIVELSELTGVSKELLRKQIFERHWPIEKVMAKAGINNGRISTNGTGRQDR